MDALLAEQYENEIGAPFTDSLTGLYNNGFFQISLEIELKRFERYGNAFSIALIDVDSFSHFNMLHGPLEGDRLLKQVAGLIKKNSREVDLAARYSGNLFAVIVTKSNCRQALKLAERIRHDVEKKSDGASTVSIGLACCPDDATTGRMLISKANEALLKAKIQGKNSIHFFEKEINTESDKPPTILIVDDDSRNLKLLEGILFSTNCELIKATNGIDALNIVNKANVDLVLLDVMMPEMDGYEVCRHLKGSEATRLIPVVLVTALDDREAKIKGIEAGADDFITKPPNKMELLARTKSLIKLKRLNDNLTSIEYVLFSLAKTVEAKDEYTQGHVERVSKLAIALGKKMGLSEREMEALRYGGILHDIGKIAIPGDILNKPGPLSPEEWEVMKSHPVAGYNICLPLKKNLGSALEVIRHHHEKLDGSGYPDGLKNEEISPAARIMVVVDIYDALITDRPYREGMPLEKAIEIIKQEANNEKLDKVVVGHLIEVVSGDPRVDAPNSTS
ncbi:MAG: diguanylate cyclase [Proteobacteria bacterium]|nr:diguanylate cyclase [Pseudomonadota bacterium]